MQGCLFFRRSAEIRVASCLPYQLAFKIIFGPVYYFEHLFWTNLDKYRSTRIDVGQYGPLFANCSDQCCIISFSIESSVCISPNFRKH